MKQKLLKQYQDLEKSVHDALRKAITKSKSQSQHCGEKCLQIDIEGFTGLALINDELTLLDDSGFHYDISPFTLDDLIGLIPK